MVVRGSVSRGRVNMSRLSRGAVRRDLVSRGAVKGGVVSRDGVRRSGVSRGGDTRVSRCVDDSTNTKNNSQHKTDPWHT